MIEMFSSWLDFVVRAYTNSPAPLKVALATYPLPCALAIHWTQGLKRQQRKRKLGGRENFTSFELRGISSCIAGVLVSLLIGAFYPEISRSQLLVHMIFGGASAPLLMGAFLGVLAAFASKFPSVAAFRDAVKTGDRRKREGAPPLTGERRDPEDTGEFWSN